MYQNIVKPTFVLTADVIDELLNSNLLNNKWCCWERFIRYLFLFVWHNFSTLDVSEHNIETLHAYKKDTQSFQGVSLIFCLYVCSSIPATPLFSLLPSYAERPYWHNQCFWCSVLLVSIVLPYNYTGSSQSIQSYNFQYRTHQRYQTLKSCCLFFLSYSCCILLYASQFFYSNFRKCSLHRLCCIQCQLFCKSFRFHTCSYLYLL